MKIPACSVILAGLLVAGNARSSEGIIRNDTVWRDTAGDEMWCNGPMLWSLRSIATKVADICRSSVLGTRPTPGSWASLSDVLTRTENQAVGGLRRLFALSGARWISFTVRFNSGS